MAMTYLGASGFSGNGNVNIPAGTDLLIGMIDGVDITLSVNGVAMTLGYDGVVHGRIYYMYNPPIGTYAHVASDPAARRAFLFYSGNIGIGTGGTCRGDSPESINLTLKGLTSEVVSFFGDSAGVDTINVAGTNITNVYVYSYLTKKRYSRAYSPTSKSIALTGSYTGAMVNGVALELYPRSNGVAGVFLSDYGVM